MLPGDQSHTQHTFVQLIVRLPHTLHSGAVFTLFVLVATFQLLANRFADFTNGCIPVSLCMLLTAMHSCLDTNREQVQ